MMKDFYQKNAQLKAMKKSFNELFLQKVKDSLPKNKLYTFVWPSTQKLRGAR